MFCVGDIVVYGAHGLCKVDGIGPLPMKFADKSKRYYTLHTCKQPSMTIYAPVDNQTVVMRQPLNRAQAETLISEMPQYAVVPIMDAKERESRCREALQTCDCREIAKMIKGLHDRHEIRVQHKKHDTAADERYFRQAQERLYSELAYALGIEEDAVPDYIAQLCFCFSECPAERLICPSKSRQIKEKNKRFHRLEFFSFSFCRYSCCFSKSLPSLPGRAGQGIDGLVSSRKSKSSPGTFPNYCK